MYICRTFLFAQLIREVFSRREMLDKVSNKPKFSGAVLAREHVRLSAEHMLGLHVLAEIARVP
jgi:hypothetical protein